MRKFNNLFAVILVATLMLSLAACSGDGGNATTSDSQTPSASSSATAETPAGSEDPDDAEITPSEEPAAAAKTWSYPIEGGYELLMANVYNPNASAVYGNGDYSDAATYDAIVEATGITINFKMLPEATHQEQLDLMIASGDTPDLYGRSIGSYDSKLLSAIEEEVVIDVMPYLEEYAPDFYKIYMSDENYRTGITNSDGSVCRVPGRTLNYTTQGLLVRGDWLDALGLDVPSTVAELTEVLRAFKAEYNTSMTLLINNELDCGLNNAFNSTAMGLNMMTFQQSSPNSGEVICSLASEGYLEYLLLLNQYFEEGLINDDFLSIHKNNNNYEPYYLNGRSGVWYDDAKNALPESANDPNWRAVAFNIERTDDYHLASEISGGGMSMVVTHISASCEIPEVAVQLLNFGFTEEGGRLIQLGTDGLTYEITADGSYQYTDLITNNPDGLTTDRAMYYYLTDSWMITNQLLDVLKMSVTDDAFEAYETWTNVEGGDDSMALPNDFQISMEDFMRVMEYQNDVMTLFNENAAKVVMGTLDADGYRDVIDIAYQTGLTEITAIYSAAYEQYLADNQ